MHPLTILGGDKQEFLPILTRLSSTGVTAEYSEAISLAVKTMPAEVCRSQEERREEGQWEGVSELRKSVANVRCFFVFKVNAIRAGNNISR